MQSDGNEFRCEMLQCNRMFTSERYCARQEGTTMSDQLQVSSIFSVVALAALCIVASTTGHFGAGSPAPQTLVQAELAPGLPG